MRAALVALVAACAPLKPVPSPPPQPAAQPIIKPAAGLKLSAVSFRDLAGWAEDSHGAALIAFRRSCKALLKPSHDSLVAAGDWRPSCKAAEKLAAGGDRVAMTFFETWFTPYRAAGDEDAKGLFTGYYEAALKGSWRRSGPYTTPIYTRPSDLVTADLGRFKSGWKGQSVSGRVNAARLVPFATRAEIERGALSGRGLELMWVDDPVDAFFLHIQGSGRVVMEDGRAVRLGYAGKNGHPYVAIGRRLISRGVMTKEEVSMQSI
ncbi:MAG: MltA domain-containing protein, partial [Rhodospirillales bacterium]